MTQWLLLRNGLLHCSGGAVSLSTATASSISSAAAVHNRHTLWLRRFSTIPDRHRRNHFKPNRKPDKPHEERKPGNDRGKPGNGNAKPFASWDAFDSGGRAGGTGTNASGNGEGGGQQGSGAKHQANNKQRNAFARRGNNAAANKSASPLFTNKFQNLLSFAFDDDDDAKDGRKKESVQASDAQRTANKSPFATQTANRNAKFGAAARSCAQEAESDSDDEDIFSDTNDLAVASLVLDAEAGLDDSDDSATPTISKVKKVKPRAEDAAKKKQLKHQKKKDGRSLLKTFKFENSIFGVDDEIFSDVDWESPGKEVREERRFKRQQRKQQKHKPRVKLPPQEVEIPTRILVKDLAELMSIKSRVLIRALKDLGERVTDDSVITNDIAEVAVESLNMIPVLLPPEFVDVELTTPPSDCSAFPVRPPVISVMGHVDHGKTTLLDALRKSKIAASEAGGITQSIGAFTVELGKRFGRMTFIDTPGHAAFSGMRAMGSEVTDIIVLVIAADDGVRPQTKEVIELSQKNNVPMVVAVTKVDMHSHEQDEVVTRISNELLEHGVVVENMGGDTPIVCVSGKTGAGLDSLKETIALHAEVMELRADTAASGEAVVLEAKMARGVGPQVDTVVKWGTLKNGAVVVCGLEYGKIRALVGPNGKRIKQAEPGTPVRVVGLKGLPNSGEALLTVPSEERAKEIVENREQMIQWDLLAATEEAAVQAQGGDHIRRRRVGANAKSRQIELRRRQAEEEAQRVASLKVGEDGYVAKVVPIIVKTDSMGVISAIDDLIAALPTDEAVIKRILGAVGPVSSSDLALAEATGATIYHFNVRHPGSIDHEALQKEVTLRPHNVIYSLLDDITELLNENIEGVEEVEVTGAAEIVQEIPITKSGRRTVNIAGCRVTSGSMTMQAKYRLLRDGEIIADNIVMETMRHFQGKVSEVTKGQECGLQLQGLESFKPGDVLEAYTVKMVKKFI